MATKEVAAEQEVSSSLACSWPSKEVAAEQESSSSTLPSRARAIAALVRQIWPVLFGNALQWYEFAIFAYLSPQMTRNFFPSSAVATWMAFALTFASRPVGGFVFGWLADTFGRRHSTIMSLLGMLVATVGQGLLPSTLCCGEAWGSFGVTLLIMLRLGQGLCTGGDEAAICPYVAETAPDRIKCVATGLFQVTVAMGFLLAGTVVFLTQVCLGDEAMLLWGWRIPFVAALVPGLVSLWGRHHLPESPEYLAWKESQAAKRAEEAAATPRAAGQGSEGSSVLQVLRSFAGDVKEHGLGVAATFFGMAHSSLSTYTAVWVVTTAQQHGLPHSTGSAISAATCLVTAATTLVLTTIVDLRGQGAQPAFLAGNLCATLSAPPLYYLILTHPGDPAIVGLCGILGLGFLLGLQGATPLYMMDMFPTGARGQLFGVAMNLSACFFGGFAGVILEQLLAWGPLGPIVYIAVVGGLSSTTAALAGWAHARGYMNIRHLTMPAAQQTKAAEV